MSRSMNACKPPISSFDFDLEKLREAAAKRLAKIEEKNGLSQVLQLKHGADMVAAFAYSDGTCFLAVKTPLSAGERFEFRVEPNSRGADVLAFKVIEQVTAAEVAAVRPLFLDVVWNYATHNFYRVHSD